MIDWKKIKFGINRDETVLSLHFEERTIRATALTFSNGDPIALAQDKVVLKNDAVKEGEIIDRLEVERKIKDLLLRINAVIEIREARVVAVLPLQSLYMHYFSKNNAEGDEDFDDFISRETDMNFPVEESQLATSWQIYNRRENGATGVIFGIEINKLKTWADVIASAAPNFEIFDLEPLTIGCYSRNTINEVDACFLSVRDRDAQFIFLEKGRVAYARTLIKRSRFLFDELKEEMLNDLVYLEERFAYRAEKIELIDCGKEKFVFKPSIGFREREVAIVKAADIPSFYGFDRSSNVGGKKNTDFKKEIKVKFEYIHSYCAALRFFRGELGEQEPYFGLVGSVRRQNNTESTEAVISIKKDYFKRWKKIFYRPLIIVLAAIFLGSLLFVSSIALKSWQERDNVAAKEANAVPFVLKEKVKIAVDGYSYPENVIKARMVKVVQKEKVGKEVLLKNGMDRAALSVSGGEFVWPEPFGLLSEELTFPIETSWLIYKPEEVKRAASIIIPQKLENKDWEIIDAVIEGIETESDTSIYTASLKLELNVKSTPVIKEQAQKETIKSEAAVKPATNNQKTVENTSEKSLLLAEIKKLDSNINVRSGPGLNYPVVGKAQSQKKYAIIGRTGEWINVKLDNNVNGWISVQFVVNN